MFGANLTILMCIFVRALQISFTLSKSCSSSLNGGVVERIWGLRMCKGINSSSRMRVVLCMILIVVMWWPIETYNNVSRLDLAVWKIQFWLYQFSAVPRKNYWLLITSEDGKPHDKLYLQILL